MSAISLSEDLGLVGRKSFVVDEYSFDFGEKVVGHAEFEQPVVDARQDEVGEPHRIEGIGVDEHEWDVSAQPGVQ